MAMTYVGPVNLQIEPEKSIAVEMGASYDAVSDELNLWIGGVPRPHVTEPVNAFASLLFDMETGKAVGVQIENLTAFAIYQHPDLLPLVRYLGIAVREHGDVALFSNRLALEFGEATEELRETALYVIKHIIDATGGFDPALLAAGDFKYDDSK